MSACGLRPPSRCCASTACNRTRAAHRLWPFPRSERSGLLVFILDVAIAAYAAVGLRRTGAPCHHLAAGIDAVDTLSLCPPHVSGRTFTFPRRDRVQALRQSSLKEARGRRECRVFRCTRSLVCIARSTQAIHHRYEPNTGIPCAMVLTGSFVLSPVRPALLSPSPEDRHDLPTWHLPMGRRDHTTLPSASTSHALRHVRVHRIPSRVSWRSRAAPHWDGTARIIPLIWGWCQALFLKFVN
jgi:hypothetical protein